MFGVRGNCLWCIDSEFRGAGWNGNNGNRLVQYILLILGGGYVSADGRGSVLFHEEEKYSELLLSMIPF